MQKDWKIQAKNETILSKIEDIALELSSMDFDNQNPGLLNGLTGICLFFMNYDFAFNSSRFRKKTQEIVELIINKCQEPTTGFSYCSGLSGILYGLKTLGKYSYLKDFEFDEDEYAEYLFEQLDSFYQLNNPDFLHGSDGIWFYLLSTNLAEKATRKQLSYFEDTKVAFDQNRVAWKYNTHLNDSVQPVINLSLSHGISNRLILLSLATQNRTIKDDYTLQNIKRLLEMGVNFLLSAKNSGDETKSLYPSIFFENQTLNRESRLGWCYGDIGNALAYNFAGKALSDSNLLNHSIEIMKHNINRTDLRESKVFDACLCHGSAGIGHIYNRFYQQTKNLEFKDISLFWLDKTLSFSQKPKKDKTYWVLKEDEYVYEAGLIEGVAGIGLALISIVSSKETIWDRFFLIS